MAQIYAPHRRTPAEQTAAKTEAPRMSEQTSFQGAIPDMGAGTALPESIRSKMESSFGADLSSVRLYESQAVADAGAEAVTLGNRIAFAPGRLDVGSTSGQALLGHELSHVVSQARGEVTGSGFLNDRSLEARADREGALAAAGESVYTEPVTPLSASAVSSAAGPMQAKKSKPKLGSDEKVKALYNEDGSSKIAQKMDEAWASSKASGNDKSTTFSKTMMAAGIRTDGTEAATALKERRGTAFAGLSDDLKAFGMEKTQGDSRKYDLTRMQKERKRNSETKQFGGQDFSYSPEISDFSTDAMKVMAPYLERKEVGQYVSDQYNLIKDAELFKDGKSGTALDAVMTNLFNRDLAGAMVPMQVPLVEKDRENGTKDAQGISAANSFMVRLPNLVRDMETGDLDPSQVPGHMKSAMEQYKAMRAQVGAMVDPEKYGAPAPKQEQKKKKWYQRG